MKKIRIIAGAAILIAMGACGSKAEAEGQSSGTEAPAEETVAPAREVNSISPEVDSLRQSVVAQGVDYTTTPSGLKYRVLREGTGKQPESAEAVVTVNYEGNLLDGTVFDSSFKRNEPATFPLNRVIPGWTEGVQLMKDGAIYEFLIPYNLAYGEMGGGPIPPKADLVFVVELIKVD